MEVESSFEFCSACFPLSGSLLMAGEPPFREDDLSLQGFKHHDKNCQGGSQRMCVYKMQFLESRKAGQEPSVPCQVLRLMSRNCFLNVKLIVHSGNTALSSGVDYIKLIYFGVVWCGMLEMPQGSMDACPLMLHVVQHVLMNPLPLSSFHPPTPTHTVSWRI